MTTVKSGASASDRGTLENLENKMDGTFHAQLDQLPMLAKAAPISLATKYQAATVPIAVLMFSFFFGVQGKSNPYQYHF